MARLSGHEVVGARLVGELPPPEMVRLWARLTSRIVKYGFAIEYRDLEPPRTGIFDGLHIVIDPDVDFEMQCFLLLHLFGHSVQWVAPSLSAIVYELEHTTDRTRFIEVLHAYEYQAARFGMQLMREAGETALDQWYSDFVATDWRYVEGYYRDDRLPDWKECIVTNEPIVAPLAIPPLVLREVAVRFAF